VSFVKKIKNKIMVFLKKEEVLYKENIELKNRFIHYKQCYILGTGPSINKLNLKFNENDLIISVGNFHEHTDINKIKPHIHVFAASHEPITESVLINWWKRANEKLSKDTIVLVERRDEVIAQQVFLDREVFTYSYGGHLPVDFTKKIISPWSVTIVALQFAIYLKITDIYLLGINHDWQCIKPYKHFYDHKKPSLEYYLKQENIKISYEEQKQPLPKERLYREYELFQQYETLKCYAESQGFKIYNGDKFSNFDMFEKKNYNFNS
jgi:6-hydroxymethylpterin diphosphokinase MptE-like